ncbi:MAG: valine--tRNA ligase [Candidatus Anammoxibacter sp.]
MQETISNKYNPKEIEGKWYSFWEENDLFHNEPDARDPYSIVIPPPNITGVLHMGHALNNIIQDILIRRKRMQGYNTLWMPGTDHAGIATQNVVERALAKDKSSKEAIGREAFIKMVWEWKEKYGSTIIKQLKHLGSACDWGRERFTMDEGLSAAVRETFVRLHKKGLVYKGYYVINRCPRCKTALADDEVEHEEVEGHLWHIKYPFRDDPQSYITVATTRPETMLGDVAVAVNPDDDRYKEMIGKVLVLPIVNREIKIFADDFVGQEFGTGAVKITPAHDNNDFEMALRHDLDPIIVMNDDGTMNSNAGDYNGMDRFKCREAVIKELESKGLMVKVEPHTHSVGHCYRCSTVIEPYLSNQWFIKMKPLAKAAIESAKTGQVKFFPERWTRIYLDWLENVRDWCISRQIWWGHRIPAWYCEDCNEINVDTEQPEACSKCGSSKLRQEEDVLDTWFSSALWPFSTMGWPGESKMLDYYYPTSTLVTDRGIIYFWVARMVMMGLEIMQKNPFSNVYIHGTILDETGRKMSKSLGNGIDPLQMIDRYGADAVRISLILLTSEGQDIKLSESKFEMGRNFANKIWNATRFALMNIETGGKEISFNIKNKDYAFEDSWIISRLNCTIENTSSALEGFKFNDALRTIYDFFWHEFCDWYLEIIKPRFSVNNEKDEGCVRSRFVAQNVLVYVLDKTLRLLHPFAPFLTEELWQKLKSSGLEINSCELTDGMDYKSIMDAAWPEESTENNFEDIENEMSLLQDVVRAIRNIRNKNQILEKQPLEVMIAAPAEKDSKTCNKRKDFLSQTANTESITVEDEFHGLPENTACEVVGQMQIFVLLDGILDMDVETKRLEKRLAELEKFLAIVRGKLDNNDFIRKAPGNVVAKEQSREKELVEQIDKLKTVMSE